MFFFYFCRTFPSGSHKKYREGRGRQRQAERRHVQRNQTTSDRILQAIQQTVRGNDGGQKIRLDTMILDTNNFINHIVFVVNNFK